MEKRQKALAGRVERPWVHGELPWLWGPMYCVRESAWPLVDGFLVRHGYRQIELDGAAMTSRAAAHDELNRAFGFPDWCGHSWDGFDDCLADFMLKHDGELIAVVWRGMEAAAGVAPVMVAEVGWRLIALSQGDLPLLAPGYDQSIAVHVFAVGAGPDFLAPIAGESAGS